MIASMRSMATRLPIGPTRSWVLTGMTSRRTVASNINRPSPPPLSREQQREFEELMRTAQAPLSGAPMSRGEAEAELALHPDAREPIKAQFEGNINPKTGEEGGPKREPVGKWVDDGGDWSHKGRVTDF